VRNAVQAVPGTNGRYANQTIYAAGIRHTMDITSRFEWGWQVYYTYEMDTLLAPDHTNQTDHVLWAGLLLAF
jgi:hypothetical protein